MLSWDKVQHVTEAVTLVAFPVTIFQYLLHYLHHDELEKKLQEIDWRIAETNLNLSEMIPLNESSKQLIRDIMGPTPAKGTSMDLPIYSQRDPRWAQLTINNTTSTLGDYGCTITSLAMLFRKQPDEMLSYLQGLGAFQADLVWWAKIPHFKQRFYCTDVLAPMTDIKTELDAGRPVIINVHFGSGNPFKPNHWVLLIDSNLTIQDPWYGDRVNLETRYGPAAKAILGGAYFEAIPVEWPKDLTTKAAANIRNAPHVAPFTKLATYPAGTQMSVVGQLEGDAVEGNNKWYQLNDGNFVWSGAF